MQVSRHELHRLVDSLPEECLSTVRNVLRDGQVLSAGQTVSHPTTSIDHVALWVNDLDRARAFYERWFRAKTGPIYSSKTRPFRSHFLSLDRGARLEIMASPDEAARPAHISVSLGSSAAVDDLVRRMQSEGVSILSEPRRTGDGYYEAMVLDCEGSPVEITA